MTETMQCYYEQVVMDLDYAALNAESGWELKQFLDAVREEVAKRVDAEKQIEESGPSIPDEPDTIEEITPKSFAESSAALPPGKGKR